MDVLKEYDEKMKPLRRIVGVAMEVYNEWGAGLLESAYEAGMKHLLDKDPSIKVERQKPLPMYEERRWGTYRVLDDSYYADGRHSLTKSITLKAGKNISYQIHHHRSEVWTFVEGEGIFVLNGEERKVKVGDTVIIPLEHWHAIKAITELTFIEVQSGNPLIEDDIERTEWNWKC